MVEGDEWFINSRTMIVDLWEYLKNKSLFDRSGWKCLDQGLSIPCIWSSLLNNDSSFRDDNKVIDN